MPALILLAKKFILEKLKKRAAEQLATTVDEKELIRKVLLGAGAALLALFVASAIILTTILGAILGGTSPTLASDPILRAGGALSYNAAMPDTAVDAYNRAAEWASVNLPACKIDAAFLAAEGATESGHGSHGGATMAENGDVRPYVIGPRVSNRYYHVDRDGGRYDFDTTQDLAVGPMQFMAPTWMGLQPLPDGNADGVADPHNYFDATIGSAILLCSYGQDLSTEPGRLTAATNYSGAMTGYADVVNAHYNDYLQYLSNVQSVLIGSDIRTEVLANLLTDTTIPESTKSVVRFALDQLGDVRGCLTGDAGENGRICTWTANGPGMNSRMGPNAWDCSGLAGTAWNTVGAGVVPWTGGMTNLPDVPGANLAAQITNVRPGDLILYDWDGDGAPNHVSIALYGDLVIESSGGKTLEAAAVKFTRGRIAGSAKFILYIKRPVAAS